MRGVVFAWLIVGTIGCQAGPSAAEQHHLVQRLIAIPTGPITLELADRRYRAVAGQITPEGVRIAAATKLDGLEPGSRYILARLFWDRGVFASLARALLAGAADAADPRQVTVNWLEHHFAGDPDYAGRLRRLVEAYVDLYAKADTAGRRAIMRVLGLDLSEGVLAPERFRQRVLR